MRYLLLICFLFSGNLQALSCLDATDLSGDDCYFKIIERKHTVDLKDYQTN